jgi:5-methyltetrahydrofolate--homocysteine methyltransferase
MCHCDGENLGLMDMIRDSGVHVAESVCPYPMTKVKIEEYYQRWGDHLTIFGGIPSDVLLAELTTDEEFEAYMDQLFKGVVPGTRLILGIADATPANAVFDRLVRIEERLEKEGRLPLEARGIRVEPQIAAARVPGYAAFRTDGEKIFETLQEEMIKGDHLGIQDYLRVMIDKGVRARDILQRGLIPAMEFIGERFKAGDVFIPEVLLSARTMNAAVSMLEPYLTSGEKGTPGKILIGTVHGDYHDIGKNIVTSMLRGVGFEVRDLGINIPTEEFVRQVADYKPDILALSALLTTTLPEMKKVIDAVTEKGLRASVKILVGGAPVNERFAQTIGADGYGQDAGGAVNLAKQLMEKHPQPSA